MFDVRIETDLLIAFLDLSRFAEQSQSTPDRELALGMNAFYELVTLHIERAGGHVVKFIGDAALVVFDSADVDRGVGALLELPRAVEQLMQARGWTCRLRVKVHYGSAVVGPFGAAGHERLDVLGKAVNLAARLPAHGFTLSVPAFRKLGPAARKRFKKHTPQVTYLRVEDRHPST